MITEQWKDFPDFEGLYSISNCGKVKSKSRKVPYRTRNGGKAWRTIGEKIIAPQTTRGGYVIVHLYANNIRRAMTVHRAVYRAFNSNSIKGEINHKDGNKQNNNLSNLEDISSSENKTHAVRHKLNSQAYAVIGTNIQTGERKYYPSAAQAAYEITGKRQSGSSINACIHGKQYKAHGHTWVRA